MTISAACPNTTCLLGQVAHPTDPFWSLAKRPPMTFPSRERVNSVLLLTALAGLLAGLVLHFTGQPDLARTVWRIGVAPVLIGLVIEIVQSLREGEVGLDIVAALSMSAALLFDETLAAAVVALMYSGGTFLESFAEGRHDI